VVPPLVNSFSAPLKESSLVSVLALTELTRVSDLAYTRTRGVFKVYVAVGALYLIMTHTASTLSSFLERRFRVSGPLQ
jgi:polar amino acid transport system permease protein